MWINSSARHLSQSFRSRSLGLDREEALPAQSLLRLCMELCFCFVLFLLKDAAHIGAVHW